MAPGPIRLVCGRQGFFHGGYAVETKAHRYLPKKIIDHALKPTATIFSLAHDVSILQCSTGKQPNSEMRTNKDISFLWKYIFTHVLKPIPKTLPGHFGSSLKVAPTKLNFVTSLRV